jgi:hypothetical protein
MSFFLSYTAKTTIHCCFNHIIGLPKKDGKELRIFDYEQQLVNALDSNNDVFVKKARGLGITEILLRYMFWLCVKERLCVIEYYY